MAAASVSKKLQGKVAIVTGGASGIGEATARLFAAYGARAVVIGDIQDEKGRSVAESIGSDRCSYFHCDVTDEEQVKSMVAHTVGAYGSLDVMFSNAGMISEPNQSILDLDLSVFDTLMKINTRGMAACVKHAALKMVELGVRGSIVCSSSAAVEVGIPLNVDYGVSKHAVVGLMGSAYQKLGEHGIRINCISPAVVATPMSARIGLGTVEATEAALGTVCALQGVTLTPERVAEAVAFLASDEAAFVTGHNLVVAGGMSLHAVSKALAKAFKAN
ncbi:(-)-isopiperitenol/(-)-carveol dehydrogenase, mitochondrial-like [Andrographis paniculata]|uniref:(-)-isopiperitenol/(-)-carveol dehydrogenase, mitochondrial-like n=1 Tax=Andrographis paniculata TaxID=175694 RepID=UPI0021E70E78|nr:(-)-isopiperitenol/(-)-carveol dehydrogenase, mitochondrial-like [Andrographis paniculata]